MNFVRMTLVSAGRFILISLSLAQIYSTNWLWRTIFVGLNMLQAAFTRYCPIGKLLVMLGWQAGTAFPETTIIKDPI